MEILVLFIIGVSLAILHHAAVKSSCSDGYNDGYWDATNDIKDEREKELSDIIKKIEDE